MSGLLLFFYQILIALIRVICLLISIAYFTLAERKVMGAIHRRRGPNTEGFWGLLQPLFDGAKLIFKEMIVPTSANKRIFLLAPFIILIISLSSWTLIPFGLYEPLENISFDTAVLGLVYECDVSAVQFIGICLPFSYQDVVEFFETEPEGFYTLLDFHNYFFNLEFSAASPYGLVILLAFSSLNVYSIIIAGWSSSSKYAFLGALRSASQMVSYEVALSVVVLSIVAMSGSFDLTTLVWMQNQTIWFIFPLFPIFVIFFISALAETNRAPFDLPEAEAELVAGYNVEYSAIIFAMFFLAEYCNMILMSLFTALAFLGGWALPFLGLVASPFFASFVLSFKTVIFCVFFIIVRASFPRYRYDQLMDLGWKVLMPIATGFFLFEVGVLWTFQWVPLPFDNLPPTWYQPANFFYDPEEVFVKIPLGLYSSAGYATEIFYNFRINSFFYYCITTGVLICASLVLVFGHPVHSLLALIFSFMQLTLLMVCNKIEYFGFVFLIVYVGAVSILFLFILMLFDLSVAFQQRYSLSFKKKVFSFIFILTTLKIYSLFSAKLSFVCEAYLLKSKLLLGNRILNSMMFDFNEIFPISLELYKFYALPFFFIVILLLSAMLGSIIIAMNASSGVFCRYNVYHSLKTVLFQSLNPVNFSIFPKTRPLILKVLLRISDFPKSEDVSVPRSGRLDWYNWSSPAIHKYIGVYSLTASHLVLKPLHSLKRIKLQNVV